MLTIVIPDNEFYDNSSNRFFNVKETTLQLEHSLVSLSKWESKFCKPFLTKDSKTNDETIEYIRCMTINPNVDPLVYQCIPSSEMRKIGEYIQAPMTATVFPKEVKKPNREIITSEIIYYWMITYNIPPEYQKWHLNRLLTLIQVCNVKNQSGKKKKMSTKEIYAQNAALNNARRQALNSAG